MLNKKLFMSFIFAGALCTALPAAAKPDNPEQKVDKEMNRIVRALERNKKSAQVLIQAARNAGADPSAVAELEQMSAAFREAFMATVSPQQIVESILGAPEIPDGTQGLIITGPDGSTWLVMPSDQEPQGTPRPGCPAFGNKPGKPQKFAQPQPGMQVPPPPPGMQPGMQVPPPPPGPQQGMAPQNRPPRFTPPQPGMPVPPPPPGMQPGMQVPPPPPGPQQGMAPQNRPPRFTPPQPGMQVPPPPPGPASQGDQVVEGELIILEDVPQYMPLWPTKEDLGKDGVLKYLEKRDARIRGN